MPRRSRVNVTGLRPWSGPWPKNIGGKARTEGAAHSESRMHGGAEPRLTSGGAAAAAASSFNERLSNFKTVTHIRRRGRNYALKTTFVLSRETGKRKTIRSDV
jgi:hypothetical protein